MKYYEILVISNEKNSHYEGRFFLESQNVNEAVKQVKDFLEIEGSNEFKIFTRELNRREYLISVNNSQKNNEISNNLITNLLNMDIDNIAFNKIAKTNMQMEFLDLKDIG